MIRGTQVDLRAVDRTDLDRIHAWLDDPDLMRCWGYGAAAVSRSSVEGRIEEWLAVEHVRDHPVAFVLETLAGESCGLVVLSRLSQVDRSCELSLFIESSFRGRGIGADALESITDAAFSQWNLHRLTAHSEQHNEPAHAFFRRHGFLLEGRMRGARFLDGRWHDVLIFGRIHTDEESP